MALHKSSSPPPGAARNDRRAVRDERSTECRGSRAGRRRAPGERASFRGHHALYDRTGRGGSARDARCLPGAPMMMPAGAINGGAPPIEEVDDRNPNPTRTASPRKSTPRLRPSDTARLSTPRSCASRPMARSPSSTARARRPASPSRCQVVVQRAPQVSLHATHALRR